MKHLFVLIGILIAFSSSAQTGSEDIKVTAKKPSYTTVTTASGETVKVIFREQSAVAIGQGKEITLSYGEQSPELNTLKPSTQKVPSSSGLLDPKRN